MLKSELIEKIAAQNPHLYREDAEKIVNTILHTMTEALARGRRVELRGFGAFRVKSPDQGRGGADSRDRAGHGGRDGAQGFIRERQQGGHRGCQGQGRWPRFGRRKHLR
jgi:hypothetical protein